MTCLPITKIEAKTISLQKGRRLILNDVNVSLHKGEIVGLIGPNGAGKTSLMRALMRFDPDAKGECNLWNLKARTRAQTAGWLAQTRGIAWDMSVEEVVALGRIAWRQPFVGMDIEHEAKISIAIETLDLEDMRARAFHSLSGGEQARVLIARLLAQDTPFICADEPIAALDPQHQIHVMEIFQQLTQMGHGVLISIHDLGLAARFCSRLVLMNGGQIVSEGAHDTVLNAENLRNVFRVEAYFGESHGPIVQPVRRLEN